MDDDLAMLDYLGFKNFEDLFSDIPAKIRKDNLRMDPHHSEYDLIRQAGFLASKNNYEDFSNFLGCGVYDRIIPSSVDSILSRSEFLTAYTPYQAEISQGMLQSLFEYQSIISDLFGMDVTNSSMYDGPTSLGEAVRMAIRVNERRVILLPENIYRNKMKIIENYTSGLNVVLQTYKLDDRTGMIDLNDIASKINQDVSAVVVENPNSYGIIDENVLKVKELLNGALLIAYVDPVSLGAVRPPGSYGADIAVAEGQQLGIHQNFGGPYLGIFTFRKELARKAPGRIIGQTTDVNGRTGYVMTLQTREQHIRRAKATSNICTNQALMAVAAVSYLTIIGPDGLRKVALASAENSIKLKKSLSSLGNVNADIFTGTSFSDVPVRIDIEVEKLQEKLKHDKIFGGIDASSLFAFPRKTDEHIYFFSVTEKTTDDDIKRLSDSLGGIR
ncbi:MAG: aminomethyl-transferring glycine dehydrogenase subunit GcvPA [Candidatus Thermoplasmatota archaeon]|nr:aminomethyl-transferring glycine dehydrogenase subunit GcvPA [Candidatus Thermoplasmatota archaeon]